ncbi:MAG: YCF48-related protein [Bacteroidia bacterium]|nr:YCF48-related protein [Bacteroidia bacterium]
MERITWLTIPSGTTSNLRSVCFPDANTGYIVGDNGTILKTTDNGSNWNSQFSGTLNNLMSVCFIDADTGIVVGIAGTTTFETILKTTDGGITWNNNFSTDQTAFYVHSVFCTNSSVGYIALGGCNINWCTGGISKTTDGGITWNYVYISGSHPDLMCSIYFPDVNVGYAAGNYGTIIKTTDGGNNWTTTASGTSNDLYSVYFTDSVHGYAVGANGTILRTSNGGFTAERIGNTTSAEFKVFPDPATDYIHIELPEFYNKSMSSVSVYGLNGQELIKQQLDGSISEINISSLTKGIYFIRIMDHENTEFGKFIRE